MDKKCDCNLILDAPEFNAGLSYHFETTSVKFSFCTSTSNVALSQAMGLTLKPPTKQQDTPDPELFLMYSNHLPFTFGKIIIVTDNEEQFDEIFRMVSINHAMEYSEKVIDVAAGATNLDKGNGPYIRTFIVEGKISAQDSFVITVPALTNTKVTFFPGAYKTN